MAEIAARLYREESGFRAVLEGWGTVQGKSLNETIEKTRSYLREIVTGAFPDRAEIDPAGADLVVRFSLELRRIR